MDEVIVAILFAVEAQSKAVRKALVVLFRADIRAPIETLDARNLLRQRAERIDDFLDLRFAGRRLEFEGDHVQELVGLRGLLRSHGAECDRGKEAHEDEEYFHESVRLIFAAGE